MSPLFPSSISTKMLLLPVELKRLCIGFLDDDADTLKQLRLVNHEVGTLATKVLFHTAVLNPTDDSAKLLAALVHSKFYRDVKCVIVNDFNFGADELEDSEEELKVTESCSEALASLCKFENLQELRLKFAVEYAAELNPRYNDGTRENHVNQTVEYRSAILGIICKAVESLKNLRIISIRDLQDHINRQILESEAFRSIRSRLTGLHLQITTEKPYFAVCNAACHRGLSIDLPELWLQPVLPYLTHLTLYSYTCMWGLYPFVDFREIGTFPCLKSLSLGNWTIAHDWQIDWILSHGSTLKELLLDDCSIIPALRMAKNKEDNMASLNFPDLEPEGPDVWGDFFMVVNLRWHQVLDRFRNNLLYLEHFALRCTDGSRPNGCWSDDDFDYRYTLTNSLRAARYHFYDSNCLLYGFGYVPQWVDPGPGKKAHEFHRGNHHPKPSVEVEFPDCDKDDAEALGRLMEAVNKREFTRV
jgi:hypothetical protein